MPAGANAARPGPTCFAPRARVSDMDRDRAVLLALLAVFLVLGALIVRPFLQFVLLALLLGYVLYPAYVRLAPRTGPRTAAAALITVTFLLIVLPLAGVIALAVDQAASVVRSVRSGAVDVAGFETAILEYTGVAVDLEALLEGIDLSAVVESAGGSGTAVVGNVVQLVGGVSDALVGFAIAIFLLYYVLTDGERFVAWTYEVSPLSEPLQEALYDEIDQVMWAVLVGNVLVAVIQGVLTGVGLFVVGVPNVIFWTLVTTVLSLLPLIGAFVVWFPIALYLLATDQFVVGVFLLVYGATVVSLSDNYLRPILVDRGAHLNPGVIILGLFGGVYAFGFMGLFFGPVVLGVLKTLLVLLARERGQFVRVEP